MKKFTLTIEGTRPLLMHNARLVDRFDPIVREMSAITGKRKKTDEDHELISHLEWQGGLYFDEVVGPYLPGDNVFKSLVEGARKSKDGKRIEQGLIIEHDVNPLAYKGPRDLAGLWADENFVFRRAAKVGMAKVIRTRPMFRDWRTEVEGSFDEQVLDLSDLKRIAEVAGSLIGVGDWRPKHGRFIVEVSS